MLLKSVEVEDLTVIKGIRFPRDEKFRQIIITGPPCSGKTTLINALGGWPQEGYVDLAQKSWWRSAVFTYRPREFHFGIPFQGFKQSHAVFDQEWMKSPSEIEFERIKIPPKKRWVLETDWRRKYVFDFQLLPPNLIYNVLITRTKMGTHPLDALLTEELVARQVAVYSAIAKYFHQSGLRVYVRHAFAGHPRRIVDQEPGANQNAQMDSIASEIHT